MSAGMNVMCSIQEGVVKNLQESPVRALQGNELAATFEYLQIACVMSVPVFRVPTAYLDSLTTYSTDWWMALNRAFYVCDSVFHIDADYWAPGSPVFDIAMQSSMDATIGASPPRESQQPTGTDCIWFYDSGTNSWVVPSTKYFAYWRTNAAPFATGVVFTDTSVEMFTGTSEYTGLCTVSSEYDYASNLAYAKSRLDTVDAAAFAALWAMSPSKSKLFDYANQGGNRTALGYGGEITPVNAYPTYNGNETVSLSGTTTLHIGGVSNYYLTEASIWPSLGGSGRGQQDSLIVDKGQLKYLGYHPIPYFLVELPFIEDFAHFPTSTGNLPFVVIASGTMNPNDIIDIPYPSYTGPTMPNYPGVGDVALTGKVVCFCIGNPTAPPQINGIPVSKLVDIGAW